MVTNFGRPGTLSGLILRLSQLALSLTSMLVMYSASGHFKFTAYWYLVVTMELLAVWSFLFACVETHALLTATPLRTSSFIFLFFSITGWLVSMVSLSGASSAAAVVLWYTRDTHLCATTSNLGCTMFSVSTSLALMAWAISSFSAYLMLLMLLR